MVRKSEKGQALVETALTFMIFAFVLLFAVDAGLYLSNLGLGWYYSFKASREASIFLQDGSKTCYQEAEDAAFGSFGEPILMMVDVDDTSKWDLTVEPCPNDPSWSPSSGVNVKATFTWEQDTIWWPGPWSGSTVTEDVFQ